MLRSAVGASGNTEDYIFIADYFEEVFCYKISNTDRKQQIFFVEKPVTNLTSIRIGKFQFMLMGCQKDDYYLVNTDYQIQATETSKMAVFSSPKVDNKDEWVNKKKVPENVRLDLIWRTCHQTRNEKFLVINLGGLSILIMKIDASTLD